MLEHGHWQENHVSRLIVTINPYYSCDIVPYNLVEVGIFPELAHWACKLWLEWLLQKIIIQPNGDCEDFLEHFFSFYEEKGDHMVRNLKNEIKCLEIP